MPKLCNENINKIRYDDLGKPIKQTSFTVKNLVENLPEKQFTIVKRSFRSSAKPLSHDSTILADELTAKTFTSSTIKILTAKCKVEFIQPSNWLYSVPNLLVIQHLVTLYLGGFDVRVVSEIE